MGGRIFSLGLTWQAARSCTRSRSNFIGGQPMIRLDRQPWGRLISVLGVNGQSGWSDLVGYGVGWGEVAFG